MAQHPMLVVFQEVIQYTSTTGAVSCCNRPKKTALYTRTMECTRRNAEQGNERDEIGIVWTLYKKICTTQDGIRTMECA